MRARFERGSRPEQVLPYGLASMKLKSDSAAYVK